MTMMDSESPKIYLPVAVRPDPSSYIQHKLSTDSENVFAMHSSMCDSLLREGSCSCSSCFVKGEEDSASQSGISVFAASTKSAFQPTINGSGLKIFAQVPPISCSPANSAENQEFSSTLPVFQPFSPPVSSSGEGESREDTKESTSLKKFECQFCDKTFVQSSNLITHLRTHTGEKPYICNVCGRSFSQSSNLRRHARIHTGEKPYQCEICNKQCSRKGSLLTHMRTHTGEKPFACAQCPKRFSIKSSLTIHERIHTGDRPFECEQCTKSFPRRSELTRHLKVHISVNTNSLPSIEEFHDTAYHQSPAEDDCAAQFHHVYI